MEVSLEVVMRSERVNEANKFRLDNRKRNLYTYERIYMYGLVRIVCEITQTVVGHCGSYVPGRWGGSD